MSNNKQKIDKDTFYRILANEAGFTLSDTKIFWKAVEDIFERAVLEDIELNLPRFGKLYVKHVAAGRGWDQVHRKWYDRKPHKRITFKLSSRFKTALDEQDKKE